MCVVLCIPRQSQCNLYGVWGCANCVGRCVCVLCVECGVGDVVCVRVCVMCVFGAVLVCAIDGVDVLVSVHCVVDVTT